MLFYIFSFLISFASCNELDVVFIHSYPPSHEILSGIATLAANISSQYDNNVRFASKAIGQNIDCFFTNNIEELKQCTSIQLNEMNTSKVIVNEGSECKDAINEMDNYSVVHSAFQLVQTLFISGSGKIGGLGEHWLFRPNAKIHVVFLLSTSVVHSLTPATSAHYNNLITTSMHDFADMIYLNKDSQKSSFSIFMDENVGKASHFVGNIIISQGYDDYSHFSKGITLKALYESNNHKFADSFQALIMTTGSQVRVYDIANLQNENIVKHLVNNGYEGRKNKCLFNAICSQETCSPLYGCANNQKESETIDDFIVTEPLTPLIETNYTLDYLVAGSVQTKIWSHEIPFSLVAANSLKPILFKNTVASIFPALNKWKNFDYLSRNILNVGTVKYGPSNKFYDLDQNSKLFKKVKHGNKKFESKNITSQELFASVIENDISSNQSDKVHFGAFFDLPENLAADVNSDFMFLNEQAKENKKQYIWVSTGGYNTYTHVDHDINIFTQIVGYKRFTLFYPHEVDNMYMFPRSHPLWHKSQVDFFSPDLVKFPNYKNVTAYTATIGPGDVLYIPSYTWHHVESLSTSISLTTWNEVEEVYVFMKSAYGVDLYFEKHMTHKKGKQFALRLFLDLLIQQTVGFNETSQFINRIISTRFTNAKSSVYIDDEVIASDCKPSLLPIAKFLYSHLSLEAELVSQHFLRIKNPVVRDILIMDYVEEITSDIVTASSSLSFFYYCFQGQQYYNTNIESEEHEMWGSNTISDKLKQQQEQQEGKDELDK